MDLAPEKIHDDLVQVELPSTVGDLKNPTEEYILNLSKQFLNKFYIDVGMIQKPTPDQQSYVLLATDNPDIISLVNLTEAMAGICSKIFLKDFHLTDITSPMPKKTRRLAKVLSNFVLYAENKMIIIDQRKEEIRQSGRELQDLKEQRDALVEIRKRKEQEYQSKLGLKEQLEADIVKMRSLKGARGDKIGQVQRRLKAVQLKKLEIVQSHQKLTEQAMRMGKMTEDLESKRVKSPERHQAHLQEIIEQEKTRTEKRQVMQEAIRSKKPAIERFESHLSFVRNEHAKFPEVTNAYKHLTETKRIMLEVQKKVIEIKSVIEQELTLATQESGNVANNAILENTKHQCEQHLCIIRNELAELLIEKKSMEVKLEDARSRQQDIYAQRDTIHAVIQQEENEYKTFVEKCQQLYDREIHQERTLKEEFEKKRH